MNKGTFSGFDRSHRGHQAGNMDYSLGGPGVISTKRYSRDELVFWPVVAGLAATAASISVSADTSTTLTRDVAGLGAQSATCFQVPADGSVVAVAVNAHFRNSTSQNSVAGFLYDYDTPVLDADDPGGVSIEGYRTYTGMTANHHQSTTFDFIRTGGLNNTQFKYRVDWVSGTVTGILYITGFWTRRWP